MKLGSPARGARFIFFNTVAIVAAAYFLLRLFDFTLASVAAPALLLAMFCTENVTNTRGDAASP